MATEGIAYFRDDGKIDWLTARHFCQRRSRYACLEAQLRLVHAFVYQHFPEIVITGWLIDGPNIPGRPFWVMRHRTPLLT